MKKTNICVALAASLLLSVASSCSSDPNPIDLIALNGQSDSYITLDLSVADIGTRADATVNENAVTAVSLYIFNDERLDKVYLNEKVSNGKLVDNEGNEQKLAVNSGSNIVYAIAAGSVSGVTTKEEATADASRTATTLTQFETLVLNYSVSQLATSTGCIMVGKSDPQRVANSVSGKSTTFSIELTRLVAKLQMIYNFTELNNTAKALGFMAGYPYFAVRQTARKSFVLARYMTGFTDENSDGTHDDYDFYPNSSNMNDYIQCEADFSSAETQYNWKYMAENLVESPVTGNTTFASVRISLLPQTVYTYNATGQLISEAASSIVNYYTVGIVDEANGYVDYIVDDNTKKVMCFKLQADAEKYCEDANNGRVSPITVSESSESLKKASKTRASETYQVKYLKNGYAYYRVNLSSTKTIGETEYKGIHRNTYYKITLKSITGLGFPNEDLLRPTNAEAPLELTPSAQLDATFKVIGWTEESQNADL